MFELAEENYRHEGEIGINSDVLRLLVKPGGAGMVVCLSSFVGRRDLIQATGGFNPELLYSQDSEFLFRLAMRTKFGFVNRPLVLFDRAPVEDRHIGVSAEWNKIEFFLRDSQMRLEGLLPLTKGQPAKVRDLVRRQLGRVHSGWVNCYLEEKQYRSARQAALNAARYSPTLAILFKSALTWLNPSLALRLVHSKQSQKDSAFTV